MPENPVPRHTIVRKVTLGLIFALLMLGAVGWIAWHSTRQFLLTATLVAHSREIIGRQQALLRHLTEAQSGARGYLIGGDDDYLQPYEDAQVRIIQDFNALKNLVVDEPEQRVRLDGMRTLISHEIAKLKDAVGERRGNGFKAAAELFNTNEDELLMTKIREAMSEFENVEQQTLVERTGRTQSIGDTTTTAIVLTILLTVGVLTASGFVIARDLAARRRAEEALAEERNRLRSIIDTMADRVFVKDRRGRYVLDNIAHREYLKLARPVEIEGKTAFDLFPKEMAENFDASDRKVLESGEPLLNQEEPAMPPRGSKFAWTLTSKTPLRDTDGKTVGLVCVSHDITARKIAEEKLRLFTDQLERSNRELQDFASVASHDLQEPLRKIRAFGDRLKAKCGDALGETGRDYLDRMEDAAGRMQTLIHDLLTLARVTSRAQPFVPVDLCEIVWDVLSDLDENIRQCGARIEVGSLPVIDADPLQMRQLFQNLVSNALKFHRPGESPVVSIAGKNVGSVDLRSPSGAGGIRFCKIVVEDNGIGFDEKFADRIFAVFQRLHAKHEYPGTGIGLAVCRKIADRHGGNIVARSAENQGSTFVVTLPVKQRMKENHEQLQ